MLSVDGDADAAVEARIRIGIHIKLHTTNISRMLLSLSS